MPQVAHHSDENRSFFIMRYNNIYYITPFYYTPERGIIQEKLVAARGALLAPALSRKIGFLRSKSLR